MGMDLYVYQPVAKRDSYTGVKRSFCLTQNQIDYLNNHNVDINVQHRLWYHSCTQFETDCLFGMNIQEANKLIIGKGSRYYYVVDETINEVPHLKLKSYTVLGFEDENCTPLNEYYNLILDYDAGSRTEQLIKIPERYITYEDKYLCDLTVTETAYYRKPFRHESTQPKLNTNGTVTISIDNFTNDLGKKAYEILATVTDYSDVDFVSSPQDLNVLKELASCSNDYTFWNNKILLNPNIFLVNINW